MEKDEVRITTVSLRKEQYDWLEKYKERHTFVLSKFIRLKLDDFRKFAEEVEHAKGIGGSREGVL